MSWDRATPFTIDLQVGAEDIDGLGHAMYSQLTIKDGAPQRI